MGTRGFRRGRTDGADLLVLRLQNVYGPHQRLAHTHAGIVGTFTHGVVREGRVELFEDGRMTRDFVFVDDVVRALCAGISHTGTLSRTLNVGAGRSVTLHDLAALLADIAGTAPDIQCSGRYRVGDVRHAVADMSAYEGVFGPWRPVALADGLAAYLQWYLEQPSARPPLAESAAAMCHDERISSLLRQTFTDFELVMSMTHRQTRAGR